MQLLILTSSSSVTVADWVTRLPTKPSKLSLVFISTASEVEPGDKAWLLADKHTFIDKGFSVTEYSITAKTQNQLEKDLAEFDIWFVAGGNTFHLLYQAQRSGFLDLLQNPKNSKIYIGSSAGSIICCPDISYCESIDDPSVAPKLKSLSGAALIPFLLLPHWGNPQFTTGYSEVCTMLYDQRYPILTLSDQQYLIGGEQQFEVVTLD